MEPTLLVGDRIFVSKYTYGYSKHSFPFSPPIIKNRIFYSKPQYGDLVVFKTPSDNRTDFIKRLIGLPGDEIQLKDGDLFVNNEIVLKKKKQNRNDIRCANNEIEVSEYVEELNPKINYNVVLELSKILSIQDRKINKKGKLKNKTFMFTGKLSNISRAEAKSMVEKNSGTVLSSVNKKLNYLVIGDKPTNKKIEHAKNIGIKIISQKDWNKLLN